MVVLDTHVLIWLVLGDQRLGRRSLRLLEAAIEGEKAAVSAITFWEVGLLVAKRRFALTTSVGQWRLAALSIGIAELPLTGDIAVTAAELEGLHSDPADRLLVATAQTSDADFVTADERILDWRGRLKRHDARR